MSTLKIELCEWLMSDAESLAENADNIKVWNNLRDGLPHPYTKENAKEFIMMAQNFPKPATLMAIVVDNRAVGSIGLTLRSDVERISAELGYFIGEKYWGKGITTEAVKQMVAYGFANFRELLKIYATPFGDNIASQRVLTKAGFVREAVLRSAAIKNGKIVDEHYYSIWRI